MADDILNKFRIWLTDVLRLVPLIQKQMGNYHHTSPQRSQNISHLDPSVRSR